MRCYESDPRHPQKKYTGFVPDNVIAITCGSPIMI